MQKKTFPIPAKCFNSQITKNCRTGIEIRNRDVFCGPAGNLTLRENHSSEVCCNALFILSFSDEYCVSHKVSGYVTDTYTSWDESHAPLKISFSQAMPYKLDSADCPFAFENDGVILSMLRAIHG